MVKTMEILVSGLLAGLIVTVLVIRKLQMKKVLEERLFRYKVIDEARALISMAIRSYQDWLRNVYSDIRTAYTFVPENRGVLFHESLSNLRHLCLEDERNGEWVVRLEEHEVVFPETKKYRIELFRRDSLITVRLYSFLDMLGYGNQNELRQEKEEICTMLAEQIGLLNDLLVCLQNSYFGEVLGRKNQIKLLKRAQPERPWLAMDKIGSLLGRQREKKVVRIDRGNRRLGAHASLFRHC